MTHSFKLSRLLIPFVLAAPLSAFAITDFSPTDFSSLTTAYVSTLIETVAIGTEHRPYMPAAPQGMLIGLDVGFEFTAISLPQDFVTAMALATGQSAAGIPTLLPVPKLNIHKGLPMGIDVGLSYMSVSDSTGGTAFSSLGLGAQYALISGAALPAVSARAAASFNTLYFLKTTVYSFDAVASKNLFVIEPYIGAGLRFWSGNINIPVNVNGLSANIPASASGVAPHFFLGTPLKLLILHFTGEMDLTPGGPTTYGLKVSLAF